MSTPGGASMALANHFPLAADGSYQFPTLPGLTLEFVSRPTFSTIVQTATDRSTARISLDPYPLWEYDLAFGYISDDCDYNVPDANTNPANLTQFQQILGLFLICGGQRATFLMDLAQLTKRPNDSKVKDVPIGIGDGSTLAFQLVRSVGGFLDLIDNPIAGTIEIVISPLSGTPSVATISSTSNGLCALSAPPPAGAIITASFSWLYRMRFTQDAEEFDGMMYQLYTRGVLKLAQERNQQL